MRKFGFVLSLVLLSAVTCFASPTPITPINFNVSGTNAGIIQYFSPTSIDGIGVQFPDPGYRTGITIGVSDVGGLVIGQTYLGGGVERYFYAFRPGTLVMLFDDVYYPGSILSCYVDADGSQLSLFATFSLHSFTGGGTFAIQGIATTYSTIYGDPDAAQATFSGTETPECPPYVLLATGLLGMFLFIGGARLQNRRLPR